MSTTLKLYELTGSPNNVKVRIALGIKGLEYERIPIELAGFPGDRSLPLEVSGQPRLPVLEHDGHVIFDSGAILRYLDANFRQTHQLYSGDYAQMGEIEQWELWTRTALSQPVGMLFGQAMGPAVDPQVCAEASALLNDVTGRIEEALEQNDYLLGPAPKAADVVAAPGIFLSMLPAELASQGPIHKVFQENFHLGEGRERTRAWVKRLMAHDVAMRGML